MPECPRPEEVRLQINAGVRMLFGDEDPETMPVLARNSIVSNANVSVPPKPCHKKFASVLFVLSCCLLISSNAYAAVKVGGYYKKDGTYVQPHYRSSPNGTVRDNYSYKGNINPYTGEVGTHYYRDNPTSEYYTGGISTGYAPSIGTVNLPTNAELDYTGHGWVCRSGYYQAGAECQPVQLPANAELDFMGHGWVCRRGYYQAGSECRGVQLPENAELDFMGHDWVCRRGYYQAGAECQPVRLPANAELDFMGHGWVCRRGYYQAGAECEAVQLPPNAELDFMGHSWVCRRGYYQAGAECQPVQLPENAELDFMGHAWTCKYGYRSIGNGCEPIVEN